MKLGLNKRIIVIISIAILIGFSIGYLCSYFIPPRELPRVEDVVGIIRIEGYILDSNTTYQYVEAINHALVNDSIKAVVLVVDSKGGYAEYVEQVYLDLLKLKEKKVLVASLITALSGGYYVAVAADYIYAHPMSSVGNVGVIGTGPPPFIPSEATLETGPYKATGLSILLFPYNLSHALDSFVSAVKAGRGDRLKLTTKELMKGMIYLGSEALKVGLVDEIGSLQNAIEEAARRTGLKRYKVVELGFREDIHEFLQAYYNQTETLTLEMLNKLHPPPAIHFIYLPPQVIVQSSPKMEISNTPYDAGGDVLVDLSHGNLITWLNFDILIAELAKRNVSVSFIYSWGEIESRLDNATCLIIASPTKTYSMDEIERIEKYVERGGLLMLFFDPAQEYITRNMMPQGITAPINSLSHKFAITFAGGYLYNEDENYGIYRNIYVKNFAEHPLMKNLDTLVFLTATHIRSAKNGIAWASNSTHSSTGERADSYTIMALVEKGNGTVIAFGDITFLTEPWCYLEDNYQLILNLASLIAEKSKTNS